MSTYRTPQYGQNSSNSIYEKEIINTIIEPDTILLFHYEQKNFDLKLSIYENITYIQENTSKINIKHGLISRNVAFTFLDLDFDNDFEVLSKALSLITIAERNQFGKNNTIMKIVHRQYILFSSRIIFNDNSYGVSLGYYYEQIKYSIEFNIAYLHHLKYSVQKAMSWLKNKSGIEFRSMEYC